DAGGTEHRAATDGEFADAIRRILADNTLPRTESVPPNQARIEDLIAEQVSRRAPELAAYAKPAVAAAIDQVRGALGKLDRNRTRRPPPRGKARPHAQAKARKPPRPGRNRG